MIFTRRPQVTRRIANHEDFLRSIPAAGGKPDVFGLRPGFLAGNEVHQSGPACVPAIRAPRPRPASGSPQSHRRARGFSPATRAPSAAAARCGRGLRRARSLPCSRPAPSPAPRRSSAWTLASSAGLPSLLSSLSQASSAGMPFTFKPRAATSSRPPSSLERLLNRKKAIASAVARIEIHEFPHLAGARAGRLQVKVLDEGGTETFLVLDPHGIKHAAVAVYPDKEVVLFGQRLEFGSAAHWVFAHYLAICFACPMCRRNTRSAHRLAG